MSPCARTGWHPWPDFASQLARLPQKPQEEGKAGADGGFSKPVGGSEPFFPPFKQN